MNRLSVYMAAALAMGAGTSVLGRNVLETKKVRHIRSEELDKTTPERKAQVQHKTKKQKRLKKKRGY